MQTLNYYTTVENNKIKNNNNNNRKKESQTTKLCNGLEHNIQKKCDKGTKGYTKDIIFKLKIVSVAFFVVAFGLFHHHLMQ